ncbi:MAG TPA: hypothetical protein VFB73_14460 [Chloroflexota bacterium]|nr:hypothetical protein [Chloroflexota bacterium]
MSRRTDAQCYISVERLGEQLVVSGPLSLLQALLRALFAERAPEDRPAEEVADAC